MKFIVKILNKKNSRPDFALCGDRRKSGCRLKTDVVSIILVFLFFLFSVNANAQRIKATVSLDSTHILIGDQVKLFLEIDHPKNVIIHFPKVPDIISGNIEVLGRSEVDTFKVDDGIFMKQIQSFLITCFDSGSYRILPFWFKIDLDGRLDSIPTNGATLNVYTLSVDTSRGPADIKMPYDAPVTLKEVIPYILGAILVGAILFFIFYALRRRKNNQPIFVLPKKQKEPAHVIALRELERIKSEKIWQKGKTKQYYSEVSETLRRYIEERFGIPAMEQTSDETLESFRFRRDLLKMKTFENLSSILKLADLVKFATYRTMPDEDNLALMNSFFFVNDTKKEEKKSESPEENMDEEEDMEIK